MHRRTDVRQVATAIAAAFAFALGCGEAPQGAPKPAAAPPAQTSAAPAVVPAQLALTPAQSATAKAAHAQFASANLQCAACHPCGGAPTHGLDWMDQTSAGFHAYSANAGLASCQGCHGAQLDGVGGTTTISCAACHGTTWATACTTCHGGTDNATGAPPRATWGNGGDPVRVGAHTAHLTATAMAPAFDCTVCHVTPANAFSAGHVDGPTATVTFAGLAVTSAAVPAWNRASGTCSNVYCHGATLSGGTNPSPVWTAVGQGQAACGTCHGLPPTSGHPAVTGGLTACNGCHPATMDASGNLIPPSAGGKHLDGMVEVTGSTCTSCHGDSTRAATALNPNIAAAPPLGTHGETATTALAVGAHQTHLAGGTLSNGVTCDQCHTVPTSMTHANGTVTVTWGALATTGGSVPTWTRSTATCASNWCHGAKLTGGTDTTPIWTKVDGTQDGCGTCHGRPPTSGRHGQTEHRVSCGYCHAPNYTTTAIDKAFHVNGKVEVQGSRITSYNYTTHSCTPSCHSTETWR